MIHARIQSLNIVHDFQVSKLGFESLNPKMHLIVHLVTPQLSLVSLLQEPLNARRKQGGRHCPLCSHLAMPTSNLSPTKWVDWWSHSQPPWYGNVAVGVGINPEEQTTEFTVHTYFYHSIGSASFLPQHMDQLCAFFGQLARQTGLTQTQGFYSCFQHYNWQLAVEGSLPCREQTIHEDTYTQ